MASGTLVEGGGDVPKNRWIENKVYTRKFHRKGIRNGSQPPSSQTVASEDGNNSSQQQQPSTRLDLASDDSTSIQHQGVVAVPDNQEPRTEKGEQTTENVEPLTVTENGLVQTSENLVNIHLSSLSKQEIQEVKQKLLDELEQVRVLLKQVEAKELQINGYSGVSVGVDRCTNVDVAVGVDVDVDVDVVDVDACAVVGDGPVDVGEDNCMTIGDEDDGTIVGDGTDCYDNSQILANDVVDNGGARSMMSDIHMDDGGSQRMVTDISLENGDGRSTLVDVSVDNGVGRRMIPEVSFDNGGGRRMIPEVSLDNGGGRRMISEYNLDNGFSRRMISEANLDDSGGRRMIPVANFDDDGARRMIPVISPVGKREPPRSLHQLRVSVMENSHGGMGEYLDREKRTPKANQYYRNSDFIVGKEKLPPPNKKSKINGSKRHGRVGEKAYGFGLIKHTSQVFKNCSSLLTKLMKHKFGWVFNSPVDVEGLCLHDYFLIIKHPMDLGTVKTRLNGNWYRSPREFAEDVRLTFRNAMTYNPKGQDAHIMAEQLSHIFEERWAVMENEYNLDSWYELYHDVSLPTPVMNKAFVMPPEVGRNLDRMELTPLPAHSKPKSFNYGLLGRSGALKKPKAKDQNKRNMTYEEKQKLSTNLQNLPQEKLDAVVEIIKRRNTTLRQHDEEIEVDIDSVDVETLWELDRFVTNYKKSLSKYKRKAELAMQARQEAERLAREKNQSPVVVEVLKQTKTDEKNTGLPTPHQAEKQQDNSSRSSSSSSSSSDSSSSSSDSDSDSSSESDAGPSPRT